MLCDGICEDTTTFISNGVTMLLRSDSSILGNRKTLTWQPQRRTIMTFIQKIIVQQTILKPLLYLHYGTCETIIASLIIFTTGHPVKPKTTVTFDTVVFYSSGINSQHMIYYGTKELLKNTHGMLLTTFLLHSN